MGGLRLPLNRETIRTRTWTAGAGGAWEVCVVVCLHMCGRMGSRIHTVTRVPVTREEKFRRHGSYHAAPAASWVFSSLKDDGFAMHKNREVSEVQAGTKKTNRHKYLRRVRGGWGGDRDVKQDIRGRGRLRGWCKCESRVEREMQTITRIQNTEDKQEEKKTKEVGQSGSGKGEDEVRRDDGRPKENTGGQEGGGRWEASRTPNHYDGGTNK
ncbi:hypothetical protein BXZ70DRAFT_905469 [Cristinia sonorae]|uniref:Uncharacterized protein n=1 Tax=Cristinia sonorae TaxID=1940300 RepID=A0A8K0UVN3_9AGAR|nr:hypothetical protein BXZ70DRAFT_905469 [Cristinia sonorae]